MGFFYRHQAMLIQQYAKRVSPVRGFVSVGGAPMLMTAKGTVSILPVDYLNWSAPLTQIASASHGGELWITGNASRSICLRPKPVLSARGQSMAGPSRAFLYGKIGDVPADVQAFHDQWREDSY
jgi:hypothetical protein